MPVEHPVAIRKIVVHFDSELVVEAVGRSIEPKAGRVQQVAHIEVVRVGQNRQQLLDLRINAFAARIVFDDVETLDGTGGSWPPPEQALLRVGRKDSSVPNNLLMCAATLLVAEKERAAFLNWP